MATARAQLAEVGAASLSLRAVARELDMVSSAVYRYVASRDELLTLLITDAYVELGDVAERAASAAAATGSDSGASDDLGRWVATGVAVREWATSNPHDYLLLYGTPVPGYAAPVSTTGPGTRVARLLVAIVDDAFRGGRLEERPRPASSPTMPAALTTDLARLATTIDVALPTDVVLSVLVGWTQMFGLLSFELTNQTRGVVDHHGALFAASLALTGTTIGLR